MIFKMKISLKNMLIKILGAIDLIGGIFLLLIGGIEFKILFFILGILFVIKSLLGMWQDLGSWIDLLAGILFLFSIFFQIEIIGIIIGICLIQKGLVSFL
jgi:hypothetical protein